MATDPQLAVQRAGRVPDQRGRDGLAGVDDAQPLRCLTRATKRAKIPAMTTLTWFGGKAGVVRNDDPEKLLHLLEGRPETFCGLSAKLRPITTREANRDGCWCETCFRSAQEPA